MTCILHPHDYFVTTTWYFSIPSPFSCSPPTPLPSGRHQFVLFIYINFPFQKLKWMDLISFFLKNSWWKHNLLKLQRILSLLYCKIALHSLGICLPFLLWISIKLYSWMYVPGALWKSQPCIMKSAGITWRPVLWRPSWLFQWLSLTFS